jgi:hypothetical protein
LQKKKKNTEMLTSIIKSRLKWYFFPCEATGLRVPLSSDNGTSPHFYPTNQNKQGKDKLKIKKDQTVIPPDYK